MLFNTLPNFIIIHGIISEKMHLKHEKNVSYGKRREKRSKEGLGGSPGDASENPVT